MPRNFELEISDAEDRRDNPPLRSESECAGLAANELWGRGPTSDWRPGDRVLRSCGEG